MRLSLSLPRERWRREGRKAACSRSSKSAEVTPRGGREGGRERMVGEEGISGEDRKIRREGGREKGKEGGIEERRITLNEI